MRWDYTWKEQIINCRHGFYMAGGGLLFLAVVELLATTSQDLYHAVQWILSISCIAIGVYGSVKHRSQE